MRYSPKTNSLELTVEEMCAYVCHDSDLTHRVRSGRRDFADGRGKRFFSHTDVAAGVVYTVGGYAECITREDGTAVLTERCFVRYAGESSQEKQRALLYLQCMGYLYAVTQPADRVCLRLVCRVRRDGGETVEEYRKSLDELRILYIGILEHLEHRAKFLLHRSLDCLPTAADAAFPYPALREGQEELIRECYYDLCSGARLFAEAPTGIGKTVSTLYPAAKAVGKGVIDRVFYLTAKASTRREAFAACKKLYDAGTRLRCMILYAREQLCPYASSAKGCGDDQCRPEQCPLAKGYYDRAETAVFEMLAKRFGYTREILIETAQRYAVCPYELSLDLSAYCDIIICDYNYVFSPSVYLRRYFDPVSGEGGRYAFLVDEAHNLADRAREMYSAAIRLSSFVRFAEMLRETEDTSILRQTEDMIAFLRKLGNLCEGEIRYDAEGVRYGFYKSEEPFADFPEQVHTYAAALRRYLYANADSPLADAATGILSQLRTYMTVCAYDENAFLFYVDIAGEEITVGVFCMDPSNILDRILARAKSCVLFSATFSPIDYYISVLGGGKNAVRICCPSPFPKENLCVIAANFVSTRYEDRDKSYKKVCAAIVGAVCAKAGNYMVYFPSYSYMEKVFALFEKQYPKVCKIKQSPHMSMAEREQFISFFRADTGKLRIGFCVLGGLFSEGIDLPGSMLIGSLIVGTGLPGITSYRNLLCEYYNRENGEGYAYAYTYPGLVNVMQAAGRVIRTEKDRGVVVLIDDRYVTDRYIPLLPERWRNMKIAGNAESLAEIAREFWKNGE